MSKRNPDQIRSSYFVDRKKTKAFGEEFLSVTVFLAEENGAGAYVCFRDSYVANNGVIANEELGRYSGDCPDAKNIHHEKATLRMALEWLQKMEKESLISGQFDRAEEHVGDDRLSPHFSEIKTAPKPATKRQSPRP